MGIGQVLVSGVSTVTAWVDRGRTTLAHLGTVAQPLLGLLPGILARGDDASRASTTAANEPPVRLEAAKYYLGKPAARRPVDHEPGELPRGYGVDRLVLLARDPWCLFAYWEIAPATRVEALRRLGAEAVGASQVLRFREAGEPPISFDVEPSPSADSCYVPVQRPGARYSAEIGLRTPAGRFLPLAVSNAVTTPRAAPSVDATVRFAELRQGEAVDVPGTWTGRRLPAPVAPPPGASELAASSTR
jgi:hypothetical protein